MSSDQSDEATLRHTTEPALVQALAEERGGFPAHLAHSEGQGDQGLLRIGFPDVDEAFKEISWDEFRAEFEEKDLAAVYPEDEDATVDGSHPMRLEKREHVTED